MIKRFNNITQSHYDRLADRYFKKIGQNTPKSELLTFKFFASIQTQLEKVLQDKFQNKGFKLVKTGLRQIKSNEKSDEYGLLYKVVSLKDAFEFPCLPKSLNLSSLMEDIRFVDPRQSRDVPDVKISDSKYLKEKIEAVADQVFQSFLTLNIKNTESKKIHVKTTRHASQGNSRSSKSNQDEVTLLP